MKLLKIFVRFRQFAFAEQEAAKAVGVAQLKFLVHFDGIEWTNFDANLAAHANRNVDIEDFRLHLRLSDKVGLLGGILDDIDALRRAFLLADLARDAAETSIGIGAAIDSEREVERVFREERALFRILRGDKTIPLRLTADEVSGSFRHHLEDASALRR